MLTTLSVTHGGNRKDKQTLNYILDAVGIL